MLNLYKYNRHWEKGFRYPFTKSRKLLSTLIQETDTRQIIEITGLRRTGKTTLLFQIINFLLGQKHNPLSLLYFTFDEEKLRLDDLFNVYSKQSLINIGSERIFVFLDEIQKLPDFQSQLKVNYDLYPNIKFFISGSTSLFIKKKSQESLAGRTRSFFLKPLDFEEFLIFTDKYYILDNRNLYAAEIEKQFEIFLKSQFIESLSIPDMTTRREYFISIVKKIIFEDIPAVFNVANPEVLWQIFRIICQRPGIYIDYQNLAEDTGISNKTVSNYLYYLEEAFLVKKLYNFSRNMITSEKKLKRFYPASPSFTWALTDFMDQGLLVENLIASLRDYRFFWRDSYHHEVDFINLEGDDIIPIEVKYKETLKPRDVKNLLLFSKKFGSKRAIVLTKGLEEKITVYEDGKPVISEMPVYFF